jgi:lipoate-protein ligase A
MGAGESLTQTWRLILDEAHDAAWNMAADAAIYEAVVLGLVPPTLRLYRWLEPSVSVGRFQSVEKGIDTDACAALGVALVRRPTGGRGILHGGDQTLSVSVPLRNLGSAGENILRSYQWLSEGLVNALGNLGFPAHFGQCERRHQTGGDCFALRTEADLLLETGEKIIGSAQFRGEGVLLQQSSLCYQPCPVMPHQVFHGTASHPTYSLATLEEEALHAALITGCGDAYGVRWQASGLSAWEEERTMILQERYLLPMERITHHSG